MRGVGLALDGPWSSLHFTLGATKPLTHEWDRHGRAREVKGPEKAPARQAQESSTAPEAKAETQNIKVMPSTAEVRESTISEKSNISFCLARRLPDEHRFISQAALGSDT